jgi:uncharacterized protein YgiM (DUF1202 family)
MKKRIDLLAILGSRTALAVTALLFALMLIVVLLSRAWAESWDEPVTMYAVVEGDSWLNVREKPKEHAAITLRLNRGDAVKVYGIDEYGWADISRAGDPGFCRIEYLSDTAPIEPETCVTTEGKVNVRKLPGGKPVRKLARGDSVTVTCWVTDADGVTWANIGDGFVMKAYLEVAP